MTRRTHHYLFTYLSMVTTVGAIGSFDGVPEDKEQFGVLDEALSDPKSRLHTARAVGGAFASMEAVRALVSMLSGDPVIGSAQAQAVDLRPGYVQLADASRGTIRDVGGATTRAVERAIDQNTDRTSAAHDAEDRAILADLASKGYSLEEQREILRIMEDSRRFA